MNFQAFKFTIGATNSLNESYNSKQSAQIVKHVHSNSPALVTRLYSVIRIREKASIFQINASDLRYRAKPINKKDYKKFLRWKRCQNILPLYWRH